MLLIEEGVSHDLSQRHVIGMCFCAEAREVEELILRSIHFLPFAVCLKCMSWPVAMGGLPRDLRAGDSAVSGQ